jgi:hypothetical protein
MRYKKYRRPGAFGRKVASGGWPANRKPKIRRKPRRFFLQTPPSECPSPTARPVRRLFSALARPELVGLAGDNSFRQEGCAPAAFKLERPMSPISKWLANILIVIGSLVFAGCSLLLAACLFWWWAWTNTGVMNRERNSLKELPENIGVTDSPSGRAGVAADSLPPSTAEAGRHPNHRFP